LRLGIWDVEAWLASIEPRVIDAWLAFAKIDPQGFQAAFGGGGGKGQAPSKTEWVTADKAVDFLAKRYAR
jgi:hypothetical protein